MHQCFEELLGAAHLARGTVHDVQHVRPVGAPLVQRELERSERDVHRILGPFPGVRRSEVRVPLVEDP